MMVGVDRSLMGLDVTLPQNISVALPMVTVAGLGSTAHATHVSTTDLPTLLKLAHNSPSVDVFALTEDVVQSFLYLMESPVSVRVALRSVGSACKLLNISI